MLTKAHTPIHEDTDLNDDWWRERGFSLLGDSTVVFRNFIRDGSGRYDGYILFMGRNLHRMLTVAEANSVMLQYCF